MYTIKTKKRNAVSLIFNENSLSLAGVTFDGSNHPTLQCLRTIHITTELISGILYNPTKIKKVLIDFLSFYNLKNVPISLVINTPVISEKFYKSNHNNLNTQDLALQFKGSAWDYRYLCPAIDHDGFIFYACGLKQEYIFHYQLFALFANINLITVTSINMAQLSLYQYIQGTAFRQSQLSADLHHYDYDLSKIFTPDIIAKTVHIQSNAGICLDKEYKNIAYALGIFFAGINHEHH